METTDNISKCGNYCHLCPAFRFEKGTDEDRRNGSRIWERCFGLHFKPETLKCCGCQSPEPWKNGHILPARACLIRACVVYNEIPNCAHCAEFPCPHITRLVPDANLREKQEQRLGVRFSEAEYREGIEPYESIPHLTRIRESLRPEQLVQPKPCRSSVPIIPFPDTVILSKDEADNLRRLYAVLGRAFRQNGRTYVEQVILRRNLAASAALIWAFGWYGRKEGDHLVVDSAETGGNKLCTRFIRKRDNQLHDKPRQAIAGLADSGLFIEFVPRGKGWKMLLRFENEAGEFTLLKTLQTYVKALGQKWGEPVYVDSYDLKGKAFKLFSRLDMTVFSH